LRRHQRPTLQLHPSNAASGAGFCTSQTIQLPYRKGGFIIPLFIQSIPLTFLTAGRYLLLLPILALLALAYTLLSVIPIIGWFVPGMVTAGLFIMGLRCALAARGYGNRLDGNKMTWFSFIFSIIFVALEWLRDFVLLGLFEVAQALDLTFDPLDPTELLVGLFVGLFSVSPYWTGMLLALLSPTALIIALMAVPMTAAAHEMTFRGRDISPFYGFGKGAFSLMVVLAVWLLAGNMYAFVGEVWTMLGLMATALWAVITGNPLPWEISLNPWSALISTLGMALASSWFFATAVLAWERKTAQDATARSIYTPAPVSTADVRNLRLRRERKAARH